MRKKRKIRNWYSKATM